MIWAAVPFGFGTRTPGLGGQVNGSLGVMRQYSAGVDHAQVAMIAASQGGWY